MMIRKTWCVLSVGVVKKVLARGFDSCEKAVATEHVYFMRGPGDAEWKTCGWDNLCQIDGER